MKSYDEELALNVQLKMIYFKVTKFASKQVTRIYYAINKGIVDNLHEYHVVYTVAKNYLLRLLFPLCVNFLLKIKFELSFYF